MRSIDSAVILAVATAVLYTWGTAYYHGYLTAFSLDADMMERSFYQVLYTGFLETYPLVLLLLLLWALLSFVYAHGILPTYVDYAKKGVVEKRRIIKIKRFWIGNRVALDIEKKAKALSNLRWIYLFMGLVYLSSLVYVERQGNSLAKSIIEQHLSDNNKPKDMVKVTIGNKEKDLRFLACGSKNCAAIENISNRIYYFMQSSGFSYLNEKKM